MKLSTSAAALQSATLQTVEQKQAYIREFVKDFDSVLESGLWFHNEDPRLDRFTTLGISDFHMNHLGLTIRTIPHLSEFSDLTFDRINFMRKLVKLFGCTLESKRVRIPASGGRIVNYYRIVNPQ